MPEKMRPNSANPNVGRVTAMIDAFIADLKANKDYMRKAHMTAKEWQEYQNAAPGFTAQAIQPPHPDKLREPMKVLAAGHEKSIVAYMDAERDKHKTIARHIKGFRPEVKGDAWYAAVEKAMPTLTPAQQKDITDAVEHEKEMRQAVFNALPGEDTAMKVRLLEGAKTQARRDYLQTLPKPEEKKITDPKKPALRDSRSSGSAVPPALAQISDSSSDRAVSTLPLPAMPRRGRGKAS